MFPHITNLLFAYDTILIRRIKELSPTFNVHCGLTPTSPKRTTMYKHEKDLFPSNPLCRHLSSYCWKPEPARMVLMKFGAIIRFDSPENFSVNF
ncbi:hypothetical protein CEXT_621691 [Caerostris extrusa]|uniref:Uncharacterized protein n=1 Tax=Caerostris extrusa TaxID=172846 RepID=A0AAV4THL5_CAEEX|nr:hypothetical protein CEXT_621691 [Caerostris extrusa]